MNRKAVLKVVGVVLCFEAALMLVPLLIALYDRQDGAYTAFILSALLCLAVGAPLAFFVKPAVKMQPRDGLAAAAACWIALSAFGAFPFYFSGQIPSYIGSVFEAASGFTTAGSSVIGNVETVARGIQFWRSLMQWFGGMGVLVLTLALLPMLNSGGNFLMRAESPGPIKTKILPKLGQTAKTLYIIYIALTASNIVLLYIAGMPLFDSFVHAFSAISTGGFSAKALSIGHYNSAVIEGIITTFSFLGGVNFSLHYLLLVKHSWREVVKDHELRLYIAILAAASVIIAVNILPLFGGSLLEALRHSVFQSVTIMTTTGYSSMDFTLWPALSQGILLLLMFIGACAGSTSGGIKAVRILILSRTLGRALRQAVHPNMVQRIKVNKEPVEEATIFSILVFFFAFILVAIGAFLIVSLDNYDMATTFSAVLACLSNTGPGLGLVGPMGNFAIFSHPSLFVLTLCMLIGRLEILPLFVLLVPDMWKRS